MKEVTEKGDKLRSLYKKIKEASEDVERAKADAGVQAISYDKIGTSGSNNNSAESRNIKYIDLVNKRDALVAESEALKAELTFLIESKFVGDKNSTRRRIYKFYYLSGLTAKETAKQIPCAEGTVKNYLFCKN